MDALLEDRQIKADEVDSRNQRDSNKIQYLSEQYQKSQSLLYESTKDFLQVKYELRAKEREWIAEKDKLLQELDIMREQISAMTGTVHVDYMLLYVTVCYCMLLYVTCICYCMLLYVTICYYMLLYVTNVHVCYCMLLYVTVYLCR